MVTSEEKCKRVRSCSRNCKLKNMSDVPMKVDVIDDPGFRTEESIDEIPPRGSVYMCYAALGIEYSGRKVKIIAYCEGDQTITKRNIPATTIRDNEEVLLNINDQNEVTYDPVVGRMIAMNGVIIMMKHGVKKLKSLWK